MRTAGIGLTMVAATLIAVPAARAATISAAHASNPQAAISARGDVVIAWERRSGPRAEVQVRTGHTATRLRATRTLTRAGSLPLVAAGDDGSFAVAWSEPRPKLVTVVRVALERPGHDFGRSQTLARGRDVRGPAALAVQPGGRTVAVWNLPRFRAAYAIARPGHHFGRAHVMAGIGDVGDLVADPRDGALLLAATAYDDNRLLTNARAQVWTLGRRATVFAPVLALPFRHDGVQARPVMGPAGAAVVSTRTGSPPTLHLNRRGTDGSWGPDELIATAAYGADTGAYGLTASLPADGAAVAAWAIVHKVEDKVGDHNISGQAVTSIAPPGAPFGPTLGLTPFPAQPPLPHYGSPQLVSTRTETIAASATPNGPLLLATRRNGAAGFGPPRTLDQRAGLWLALAASGRHVIAVHDHAGRMRLTVLR